jgi:hypothetical protein
MPAIPNLRQIYRQESGVAGAWLGIRPGLERA